MVEGSGLGRWARGRTALSRREGRARRLAAAGVETRSTGEILNVNGGSVLCG